MSCGHYLRPFLDLYKGPMALWAFHSSIACHKSHQPQHVCCTGAPIIRVPTGYIEIKKYRRTYIPRWNIGDIKKRNTEDLMGTQHLIKKWINGMWGNHTALLSAVVEFFITYRKLTQPYMSNTFWFMTYLYWIKYIFKRLFNSLSYRFVLPQDWHLPLYTQVLPSMT